MKAVFAVMTNTQAVVEIRPEINSGTNKVISSRLAC